MKKIDKTREKGKKKPTKHDKNVCLVGKKCLHN